MNYQIVKVFLINKTFQIIAKIWEVYANCEVVPGIRRALKTIFKTISGFLPESHHLPVNVGTRAELATR